MSTRQSTRIAKPSTKAMAVMAANNEMNKAKKGGVKVGVATTTKRKATSKRSTVSPVKTRASKNTLNHSASEEEVEASPQDKEDIESPEGSV